MKPDPQTIRQVTWDARFACEELEPVITPGTALNHNEAFLMVTEELEPLIAPHVRYNHNETFLAVPKELENVIAPRLTFNHNETFFAVPGLEAVITRTHAKIGSNPY